MKTDGGTFQLDRIDPQADFDIAKSAQAALDAWVKLSPAGKCDGVVKSHAHGAQITVRFDVSVTWAITRLDELLKANGLRRRWPT